MNEGRKEGDELRNQLPVRRREGGRGGGGNNEEEEEGRDDDGRKIRNCTMMVTEKW